MATKHTEGPWFHEQIGEFFSVRNIEDGEWNVICETLLSDPEDEANARLMSAAPDMLDALIKVIQTLYNSFEPDNQSAAYKTAEAAIRKAEGAL